MQHLQSPHLKRDRLLQKTTHLHLTSFLLFSSDSILVIKHSCFRIVLILLTSPPKQEVFPHFAHLLPPISLIFLQKNQTSEGFVIPLVMLLSRNQTTVVSILSSFMLTALFVVTVNSQEGGPAFDRNGRSRYFGYPSRPILNPAVDEAMQRLPDPNLMRLFLQNPFPYISEEVPRHVSMKI
jgi:hypothetical protein